MIKHHRNNIYKENGYMQGMCPRCEDWEAPITLSELSAMKDKHAHEGSTLPTIDLNVHYRREVWDSFFCCPKCQERFYVTYSEITRNDIKPKILL